MVDASASVVAEHIGARLTITFPYCSIYGKNRLIKLFICIFNTLYETHPNSCPICRFREDASQPNNDPVVHDTIHSPAERLWPGVRLQGNNVEKCSKLTTLHNTRDANNTQHATRHKQKRTEREKHLYTNANKTTKYPYHVKA